MSALSGSAVPILPSADLARTAGFLAYLGFDLTVQTPDYLQAAAGMLELHYYLDADLDPAGNPGGCLLRLADPGKFRAVWSRDGVQCIEVADSGAYGRTAFAVADPDGNLLRIAGLIEP